MMQTIPLSLPFYSRFSKDSLQQAFSKFKSSSVAFLGGSKTTISLLPTTKRTKGMNDRIRKACK